MAKKNTVKLMGNAVELSGAGVKVGAKVPNFKAAGADFKPVKLADLKGKVVLISAVPSLDTPVCALQTKRFNKEAKGLSDDVVILTVSRDLPFAQKRFCEAEKIGVQVLSDAVWGEVGKKLGLVIKDMGLLARAVFVVDRTGKLVYREVVAEVTEHPNYDKVLAAVKKAV